MKNAILTLAFALITIASFAKDKESVHVISTRLNVVYLKVEKEFTGSVLEIYNEEGNMIATQTIVDRKVLIDFDLVANGHYTIKVKKDSEVTVVDYNHTNSSALQAKQETYAIEIVQGI